ncbi:hypothetical protein R3P38DRAFT_2539992 [Favolaschia claudopus]|uniref:F-box domain-containing protein n=1 Tax=Favolaschia claudopus TaxID=2862362 RepID=A0AAW0AYM4_9AGAR
MSARSPFEVQELCDYMVDFLHDDPATLKTCALICTSMVSSAQHHLFHEVQFGNGVKWRDGGACKRFCELITSSPHLAPLVCRVRACFTPEVLGRLGEVELPNLRYLALFRPLKDNLASKPIQEAASLICRRPIQDLKLQDLAIQSMEDFIGLFQHRVDDLDKLTLSSIHVHFIENAPVDNPLRTPKPKLKGLSYNSVMFSHSWLADASFPFDLTALEEMDIGGAMTETWRRMLDVNRLSLRKFWINAQEVNTKFTKTPVPATLLARLPALQVLTIGSLGEELNDVEILLDGIPPRHQLQLVRLMLMTRPREDMLQHLGTAFMRFGCDVEVALQPFYSPDSNKDDMVNLVKSALRELAEQGRLSVLS